MRHEGEPPRLSITKPPGGNISNEPFPKALYAVAKAAGLESQMSLARVLGLHGNNSTVHNWYTGKRLPSPELFGRILQVTNPTEEQREPLVKAYSQLLQKGKGQIGSVAGTERAARIGQHHIVPSETPLGKWIETFCKEKRIPLAEFYRRLLGSFRARDEIGLPTMQALTQDAKEVLNLSDAQYDDLLQAIAKTKEEKTQKGHMFKNSIGSQLKKRQQGLAKKGQITFTGEQAGQELGFTRAAISLQRQKRRWDHLLTPEQVEILRSQMKGASSHRKSTPNLTPPT